MAAPMAPTDPAIIEAIEAELVLDVYEAKRQARLRLLGLEAPPTDVSARARLLLRRIKANGVTSNELGSFAIALAAKD